jgi:hypothetical protein
MPSIEFKIIFGVCLILLSFDILNNISANFTILGRVGGAGQFLCYHKMLTCTVQIVGDV